MRLRGYDPDNFPHVMPGRFHRLVPGEDHCCDCGATDPNAPCRPRQAPGSTYTAEQLAAALLSQPDAGLGALPVLVSGHEGGFDIARGPRVVTVHKRLEPVYESGDYAECERVGSQRCPYCDDPATALRLAALVIERP